MTPFICSTCGTQYAPQAAPPESCAICCDVRQYVRPTGQQWITAEKLRLSHRNSIRQEEPGLIGIGIEPTFGIGQRALLVKGLGGNVLWDCVPLLDAALVELIGAWGGLSAIAISHPHYYSNMVDWSRAFGGVPVYLHAADQAWVQRPDPCLHFWDGRTQRIAEGFQLIHCGGHFEGGTVLHWEQGAAGRGVLLTGDIIQVVSDRRHVSFMSSYPNYIPLNATTVNQIVDSVETVAYESLYGAFWDLAIRTDARNAVRRSADRYLAAIR